MKLKIIIPSLLSISTIPLVALSCGAISEAVLKDNSKLVLQSRNFGENVILSHKEYNSLYDQLKENEVVLAIIANHKIYEEVIPFASGDKVWDILDKSKFEFNIHSTPGLGKFINTFRTKGETEWIHGSRELKNYGDFYPLYFINHHFSEFGVSNWIASAKEVYEFTYDDK